MKKEKFKVVQKEGSEPVATEVIAQSIVKLSDGMSKLRGGGLNDRALVVLLKDATGMAMDDIRRVLRGLEDLRRLYVK